MVFKDPGGNEVPPVLVHHRFLSRCGQAYDSHSDLRCTLSLALAPEKDGDKDIELNKARDIVGRAWVTVTEGKLVEILLDTSLGLKSKKDAVDKALAVAVKNEKKWTTVIRTKIHKAIIKEANQVMLGA